MKVIQSMLRRKSIGHLKEVGPDRSNVLFATGLGINQEPKIPVRLASYLVPIITAVSEYPGTRGQFYLADKAAVRLGQEPEIVRANSQLMRAYINSFIELYQPGTRKVIDVSIERDGLNSVDERRVELVNKMVDILLETRDRALFTFAENRQKEGQDIRVPLSYMAEHTLFMRDAVTEDDDLFLVDSPADYPLDTLAMIGGPAEDIFFKARKKILSSLSQRGPLANGFNRIQLFSDIGRIPPYYARFDEPTVESGIPYRSAKELLSEIDPNLRTDYLMLLISLSKGKDFSMKSRRNELTEVDYESLQSGFNKLKYFLTDFKNEQKSLLAGR